MADDNTPKVPPHLAASTPGEEELSRLFAARLPRAALAKAPVERLLEEVQAEVRNVYAASSLPVPSAASASSRPSLLHRFRGWASGLRPVQSLALAGSLAMAILLLLVGVSRLMPRPLSAVGQVGAGEVTVLRHQNSSYRVFQDGDLLKVQKGDQIITDSGVVTLTHFPDQVAVVAPGSHVELKELDETGGGTQVALYVHDGSLHSAIDTPLGPNDRFEVYAPNAVVSAHGTEFTVETIDNEEALVTTVEGEVEVQADGQVVAVAAGETLEIAEGEPLHVGPAHAAALRRRILMLVALAAGQPLRVYRAPQVESEVVGEVSAGQAFALEPQDGEEGPPYGEEGAAVGTWYRLCCVAGEEGWVLLPAIRTGD